jgi:outer membrane protein TolC
MYRELGKTALTLATVIVQMMCCVCIGQAQLPKRFTLPEQTTIQIRHPSELRQLPIPDVETPFTVGTAADPPNDRLLSLDEAIRLALENAEVVRVLTGVSASTSGRTIYDIAIANTGIDQQNALFDPTLNISSTFGKVDQPVAILDPSNPGGSLIVGSSTNSNNHTVGLSKRNFNGSTIDFSVNPTRSFFDSATSPLDPEDRTSTQFSFQQPFMRGAGRNVNLVPVVLARIETERSFFQFKETTQELVRGVINAYWNLVSARVELWARDQQIEQAQFAFERAKARQEEGLGKATEVAQARSALANFRASQIGAKSNLLLAETALKNILGCPPNNEDEWIPTTTPVDERLQFDWNELVASALTYRPDLIELKLILEADRQQLLQANNQARPQLDGIASYRWDGLRGEMPNGLPLQSGPGQIAGYNLGVNFSVPVGLRQARAALRRQELVIARDEANLTQGVHQTVHQLAINYRNLEQFYLQITAFREARAAALVNYENQLGEFMADRQNFLNVLQAITDWGNAVSQEARAVTQYNVELAEVERQTGTILESHGIVFYEERFSAIGPLGRIGPEANYPRNLKPSEPEPKYLDSGEPAEKTFDLQDLSNVIKQKNGN